MALYFGKNRTKIRLVRSHLFRSVVSVLIWGFTSGAALGQVIPFSSAYNAGLLSADHFTPTTDAPIIQPSILPDVPHFTVSTHAQSLFTGFDLFALGLHVISPLTHRFGMNLSILSLGNPDYNATEMMVGAGRKLGERWGIGLSQRILRTRVADEGRPWRGSSSLASSYDSGSWGLALHVAGLMPWNQPAGFRTLHAVVASYVKWAAGTRLFTSLGYSDSGWEPVVGISQTVREYFIIYGAFQIYPARYSAGLTLPMASRLHALVSIRHHPILGWSPAVGLRWVGSDR